MLSELRNQFMHAEQSEVAYGRPVYEIINNRSGSVIAQIGWYPAWKRFVMFPQDKTVFDIGCLKSIIEFIESLS